MAPPIKPTEPMSHPLDPRVMHYSVATGHRPNSQIANQPYAWTQAASHQFQRPQNLAHGGASAINNQHAINQRAINQQAVEEQFNTQPALCRLTHFYVGGNWPLDTTPKTAQHRVGQMYVEQWDPPVTTQTNAIVLIHGDFHHGKVWGTKPDGKPGWASFFVNHGYQVFVVDLPPNGRSNFLNPEHFGIGEIGRVSQALSASFVERELTAQPAFRIHKRASKHKKWSGTGLRGDPVFASHCDTLTTITMGKKERQRLAQDALSALLTKIERKAVLIGEGAGGTVAWLAADVKPDCVARVIAVEPVGPPFGKMQVNKTAGQAPTRTIIRDKSLRPYGLTDIPLTYDPPIGGYDDPLEIDDDPLDIIATQKLDDGATYFMQKSPTHGIEGEDTARKLVNLMKMPHAMITGQASIHMEYDWATAAFMKQAGLLVHWIPLEDHRITGNGHLMFLETNSNAIAQLINQWIQKFTMVQNLRAARSTGAVPFPGQLRIPRPFPTPQSAPIARQMPVAKPVPSQVGSTSTQQQRGQTPVMPTQQQIGQTPAMSTQQQIATAALAASYQITPGGTTFTFQTHANASQPSGTAVNPNTNSGVNTGPPQSTTPHQVAPRVNVNPSGTSAHWNTVLAKPDCSVGSSTATAQTEGTNLRMVPYLGSNTQADPSNSQHVPSNQRQQE
ncbi:Fc.00g022850.m01.CDS01 [Cosmosporella sp. VM-42]